MTKEHSTYRLSEEAKQLISLLSQKLGVNQTAVLEIAVRKLAEMEGFMQTRFIVQSATNKIHLHELFALDEAITKGEDPRRVSGYDRVTELFTEDNGTRMRPDVLQIFKGVVRDKKD
jgi:predicted DNA-binding protein